MNDSQLKAKILDILKRNSLAVVSTADKNGRPESAIVAFTDKPDMSIILGTSNRARKYKNLKINANVSYVIGFGEKESLQYEGIAAELSSQEAIEHGKLTIAKNPGSAKYFGRDDQRYFLIKPTWIRLLCEDGEPIELTL